MISNLSQFIPSISSARNLYSNIILGRIINKDYILELNYLDVSFPSIDIIESDILSLILNNSIDQKDLILNSLWKELNSITESFYNNKRIFAEIDIPRYWNHDLKSLEAEIEYQHQKTQEASDELREISNSYEMTPFNGSSKERTELLERKLEELKSKYQLERNKLKELHNQEKEIRDLVNNIPVSLFKDIVVKCESLIPVIQKYIQPVNHEAVNKITEDLVTYIPMSLAVKIHDLCNGRQFDEMTDIDFFHAINMHPNCKELIIRKDQIGKVCYLIDQTKRKLQAEIQEEWKDKIIEALKIKPRTYKSKYKGPVSDLPSEPDKEFAESLKEIFE